MAEIFPLRLKQANFASKTFIAGLTIDLIQKFNILNGAKYFSSGILQNYLVFISSKKYIKYFTGPTRIESLKSNEITEERIENTNKSDTNFAPTFVDHHILSDINSDAYCLVKK